MNEQAKMERLLRLLMRLSSGYRYTAREIAEQHDISLRTFYRYLHTLKNVGFIIRQEDGFYQLDKTSPNYRSISELLYFSEEEAYLLEKAIHSIDETNLLKKNLVKKLHSIYDFERIPETIIKPGQSENVHLLLKAIKEKRQVVLQDYRSSHSDQIKDRLVEPFDFTTDFISVWCYDPVENTSKLFKTVRIRMVLIKDENWQYENRHESLPMDVFRISGPEKIPVRLQMSLKACNLLIEEYPLAERHIKSFDGDQYLFDGWVCNFDGIGRFVMGLIDEIEIVEPERLKEFIMKKIRKVR